MVYSLSDMIRFHKHIIMVELHHPRSKYCFAFWAVRESDFWVSHKKKQGSQVNISGKNIQKRASAKTLSGEDAGLEHGGQYARS